MAQSRGRKPEEDDERRRWVAFAVLAAVAGGTLLLGAGLSTTVTEKAEEPIPLPPEAAVTLAEPDSPAPLIEATGPSAMDRLADRTAADLERMASSSREWTNQLAVLCDTASVEELLERAGNSRDLRLLPAYVDDRTCFRVCWGSYETRERAAASADMPAQMRREFPESFPRRRDEVLE